VEHERVGYECEMGAVLRNPLIELVTNPAALDEIALHRQAVVQKESSFDVMRPWREAVMARVPTS